MLVLTDEVWVTALERIPKGKGDGAVTPSLGGSGAAFGDDDGGDGAGRRDDEAAAPSAATLGCDMPASTHVGELRRAALRRSMRASRARWPECLLR